MRDDVYISVDIEADGPIPGEYSMCSLGAVRVADPTQTFYRELQPTTSRFDPAARRIHRLDPDRLAREGADPAEAMRDFDAWVRAAAGEGGRPVFVAFNATFDWMFVHWYFIRYVGRNPFGVAGLDIKAYYLGALGLERWGDTTLRNLDPRFLAGARHPHHALEDAREQAEIFARVRAFALGRAGGA